MNASRPTVAHLVTPYLPLTASWIHSQLVYNMEFRAIVITQAVENAEIYPFHPVHNLAESSRGLWRLAFFAKKYLLGTYPHTPYRRVLEREEVRILHAHLGWEGARVIGIADNPRRPIVVSFYGRDAGYTMRKRYWRHLYKRLFRRADRILAEGHHMGRVLAEIGAPMDSVRVVHLGIPLEAFPFSERRLDESPGPRPGQTGADAMGADAMGADGTGAAEAIVGLIAASFREKKGILYALEATARLARRHPRLKLRIIGDGPLRAQIEARSARPDLMGRIELLGYQPYPVYREELARAHFMLAPSVTARDGDTEGGAPVCLLEAQASGLPIVATTHCDIPEITRPGESALLAPERDVEALAARLDELLQHPERWPQMGRAGRAHVEAEFNIHKQVGRMNQLYRELL